MTWCGGCRPDRSLPLGGWTKHSPPTRPHRASLRTPCTRCRRTCPPRARGSALRRLRSYPGTGGEDQPECRVRCLEPRNHRQPEGSPQCSCNTRPLPRQPRCPLLRRPSGAAQSPTWIRCTCPDAFGRRRGLPKRLCLQLCKTQRCQSRTSFSALLDGLYGWVGRSFLRVRSPRGQTS